MAGRKVIFSPLQRLDLIDLNAIQELTQDHYDLFFAQIFGTQRGLLDVWSSVSISSNPSQILFNQDFSFIGEKQDGSSYLGRYLGSSSSTLSLTFENAFASGFSGSPALNTVNPDINDTNYNTTTHDNYFPYVWCRLVESNGDSASRKFWDVSNQNESVQVTNTRTVDSFEFVISTEANLTNPSTGNKWTKIARIHGYTGTSGNLSINSIKPYTVSDSILNAGTGLFFNSHSSYGDSYHTNPTSLFNGLSGALQTLQERVQDLKTNGEDDNAAITNKSTWQKPDYSLQGMIYEHSSLKTLFTDQRDFVVPESNSIMMQMRIGDLGGTNIFELSGKVDSKSNLTVFFTPKKNYRRLNAAGLTSHTVDGNWNNSNTIKAAISSIFIETPVANYWGGNAQHRHVQVSVTPLKVTADLTNGYCFTAPWYLAQNNSTTVGSLNDNVQIPSTGNLIIDESGSDTFFDVNNTGPSPSAAQGFTIEMDTTNFDAWWTANSVDLASTQTKKYVITRLIVTVTLYRRTTGLPS